MEQKYDAEIISVFDKLLKSADHVYVDQFYEIEKSNKLINWSMKEERFKSTEFTKSVTDIDPKNIELLSQGYQFMSQIIINLLRDFEMFRAFPIRKYSSAYTYISKIVNFESILEKVGYENIEDKKYFKLKEGLADLPDKDFAKKTALDLLVCYLEVSEMIKLVTGLCNTEYLIDQRKENIKRNLQDMIFSEMSDENIQELFKKCEFCDGDVDESGTCDICGAKVSEFNVAQNYKDFVRKNFNQHVIDIPKNTIEEPVPNVRKERKVSVAIIEQPGAQWHCNKCTFLNHATDFCEICGNSK